MLRILILLITVYFSSSANAVTTIDQAYAAAAACMAVPAKGYVNPVCTNQSASSRFVCTSTNFGSNNVCQSTYGVGCTAPSSWSDTTHSCSCPVGQSMVNGSCQTPCPSGQYRDSTTNACVPIPDCNAGKPTTTINNHVMGGGFYFDTATNTCKDSGTRQYCPGGINPTSYYCPTFGDCTPNGSVCSNDPNLSSAAAAVKANNLASSKSQADTSAAAAAVAAQQASAAAAAKATQKTTAVTKASADAAAANAAATNTNSTAATNAAAAAAAADSAAAAAQASAAAANSQAASGAAQGYSQSSLNEANAIPGAATSGQAQDLAAQAAADYAKALQALNDALTGLGVGNGTGVGTPDCNTTGTCTTAGASTSYGGKGRFYISTGKTVSSVGQAFMTRAGNSPILKAGADVFNVPFPTADSCVSCDLSLPSVIGLSEIQMQPFCASWMPQFWAFIAAALKVATVFMAIRIIITPTI